MQKIYHQKCARFLLNNAAFLSLAWINWCRCHGNSLLPLDRAIACCLVFGYLVQLSHNFTTMLLEDLVIFFIHLAHLDHSIQVLVEFCVCFISPSSAFALTFLGKSPLCLKLLCLGSCAWNFGSCNYKGNVLMHELMNEFSENDFNLPLFPCLSLKISSTCHGSYHTPWDQKLHLWQHTGPNPFHPWVSLYPWANHSGDSCHPSTQDQ